MNRYTIYCAEEQTKKALELGAPVNIYPLHASIIKGNASLFHDIVCIEEQYYIIPTTEQMLGWLEEQGILIDIDTEWNKSVLVYVWECENKSLINNVFHGSRKEATLAAIDAALEYLSNKNE